MPSFFEESGGEGGTTLIIKFLFPAHLPFPGLSKECHKSDKLKAADYCGFMAFILPVKRANIRNNAVQPALESNPAINQHSCEEGAKAHLICMQRERERVIKGRCFWGGRREFEGGGGASFQNTGQRCSTCSCLCHEFRASYILMENSFSKSESFCSQNGLIPIQEGDVTAQGELGGKYGRYG